MLAAYVAVTLLAAAVNGFAAFANLTGHEYAKTQADKMRVPRSWMIPLGALLAAGALERELRSKDHAVAASRPYATPITCGPAVHHSAGHQSAPRRDRDRRGSGRHVRAKRWVNAALA
jgi:hypothetical protein